MCRRKNGTNQTTRRIAAKEADVESAQTAQPGTKITCGCVRRASPENRQIVAYHKQRAGNSHTRPQEQQSSLVGRTLPTPPGQQDQNRSEKSDLIVHDQAKSGKSSGQRQPTSLTSLGELPGRQHSQHGEQEHSRLILHEAGERQGKAVGREQQAGPKTNRR